MADTEQTLMRSGAAHYQARAFSAAIADFTKIIAENPKNAAAWYNRGHAYYGAGDRVHALTDWEMAVMLAPHNATYQETLKKARKTGSGKTADAPKDAQAQYQLGLSYAQGKDAGKAVFWFAKAAEQGNADAQLRLGFCYDNGDGVRADAGKAVYWYTKAAEQGNAKAQFNLGSCYHNGDGAARNEAQAVYWWTKAAGQGNADARHNLALYYGAGGVPPEAPPVSPPVSPPEPDGADAQYNLGCRYFEGDGVGKDAGQAVYWFAQAAGQGHVQAQFNLGYCYHHGEGVVQSDTNARYWWTKAAEQGDADAQNNLLFYYGAESRAAIKDRSIAPYIVTIVIIAFVAFSALGLFFLNRLNEDFPGLLKAENPVPGASAGASADASTGIPPGVTQSAYPTMIVTRDDRRLPWRSELGRYERLSLRSEPAGTIIARLERGETVTVLETGYATWDADGFSGNWLKVKYGGTTGGITGGSTGWCFSAYLDPVE